MTFKDIGRELQLAPSTISNRLYRVYRELGVTSRSSLVRLIHGQG
jgi:DNA-binding NarL/FixJ family response regulator